VAGLMLKEYGRVPVISFVFERTFSCLTPLPYSLTNYRITSSRLLSSCLSPLSLFATLCFVAREAMLGGSLLIIFSG
jgi:hypothetical protein